MAVIVHAKLKKQMIQSVCVKSLGNKKVVNVIVDYMLKSNDERIVINDYIENDPLSENNLDKTLYLVNEIRLSSPQKSIWLYTGYKVISVDSEYGSIIFDRDNEDIIKQFTYKSVINHNKRINIASMCDVIVDGRYVDSQRNISLSYRGSQNQRLIDVKQSLQKGGIVLWQT
ncbi:4Fe-4S cluster-binding domain-containing protein [Roseburia sp. 1XD42-69]|nr:4Fe-4S cluster-binding domain-containing protein [Roseburia sp. 1XD42-69]